MESKVIRAKCSDCYFSHAALCALQLEEACPTFRDHRHGALVGPGLRHFTIRPLDKVEQAPVMAQPAAAA